MASSRSSQRTCSPSSGESSQRYTVFSRSEISPASTDKFERRLERLVREAGRLIVQRTFRRIESINRDQTVSSFDFDGQSFRRNRRTSTQVDTRFGQVSYQRWFFQNTQAQTPGMAPLDVRFGLVAGRMTPALAEVTGRLAADMPQQATLNMISERFAVRLSVDAYRRVVADLATQVRCVHDDVAIEQLIDWIKQARQGTGKATFYCKLDVMVSLCRRGRAGKKRPVERSLFMTAINADWERSIWGRCQNPISPR